MGNVAADASDRARRRELAASSMNRVRGTASVDTDTTDAVMRYKHDSEAYKHRPKPDVAAVLKTGRIGNLKVT